jgi:hypothetical protein
MAKLYVSRVNEYEWALSVTDADNTVVLGYYCCPEDAKAAGREVASATHSEFIGNYSE